MKATSRVESFLHDQAHWPFRILFCCALWALSTASADAKAIDCPQSFPPHPRLFTNPAEVDALKVYIEKTPSLQQFVSKFIQRCEGELSQLPVPLPVIKNVENRAISILARDMAIAYLLTEHIQFAEAAATILLSYVPVYPDYTVSATKGKAMPSTLNEARWAIDLANAYDLIYTSGALNEKEKESIESQIFIPCGEVLRICNHKTRSNWRARAIAGLGVIGFVSVIKISLMKQSMDFSQPTGASFAMGLCNIWDTPFSGRHILRAFIRIPSLHIG